MSEPSDLKDANGVRECCKVAENLQVLRSTATSTVRQCKTCGAKHHEMVVDAGILHGRFASAG